MNNQTNHINHINQSTESILSQETLQNLQQEIQAAWFAGIDEGVSRYKDLNPVSI